MRNFPCLDYFENYSKREEEKVWGRDEEVTQ